MFKIYNFDSVESTNITAREFPHNSIIIANSQTKGHGRFNREWDSSIGGIYLSIVLIPKTDLIQQYTFIAVLSVLKAINKLYPNIKIKWPNDLMINKKKVCGILTENIFFRDQKKTIIGIGINTNNKLSKKLEKIATTLKKETLKKIDNGKIISSLIQNFEGYLKVFEKSGFSEIKAEWLRNADIINKEIKVKTINRLVNGKVIDVDDQCRIIIKQKNKKTVKIIEGDLFAS